MASILTKLSKGVPALILMLFAAAPSHAQFDTATVLGSVSDSSGAVIPNATVVLEHVETGIIRRAVTGAAGEFEFVGLRIGTYQVRAESNGFSTAVTERFVVTVNARQRVDVVLSPGQVSETVVVSGAVAQLETASSDRGTVIGSHQIVNLPLNGRAYADLALLSPGVRRSAIANERDASFNVNGQRSIFNNFVLDGVDNNAYGTSNQGFSNQVVQLSPDAVAEFKVQTNNYSAEFGRALGAVVNASLRSGTNEFHGSVWHFHRNDSLNAVGFFKPLRGVKPVLTRNQYGFTLGGPLRRDKTFYFADYEGFRQIQRQLVFASIPTMQQRQGNLGASIQHPLTGEIFSNGVIPAARITGFARNVLDVVPVPQHAGTANNFEFLPRQKDYNDKGNVKIDHQFSSAFSTFVRVSQRKLNNFEPGLLPLPVDSGANGYVRVVNQALAFGATRMLSPTSVLDVRLGITRTLGGKDPPGLGSMIMQEWGITGLPTDPRFAGGITSQSISGFTLIGRRTTNPQFQNPFVVNPRVTFSKATGRHSLKVGYEYQSINTEVEDFAPKYGSNTYGGQFSRPSGGNAALQIYNLADFLFGAQSAYSLRNLFVANLRQRMHFGYLQDDFRVSSRLTLNLGVRYEFATPHWERDNLQSNFDPATRSVVLAKAGSISDRALVDPDRHNWAPRLGFAFSATPSWVFRGGYGISYIHFYRAGAGNILVSNGPHNVSYSITQQPSQGLCRQGIDPAACFRTVEMGFPPELLDPARFNTRNAGFNYIPRDTRTGYVKSFHFTIQRQIVPGLILDVGYVGSRSTNLQVGGDANLARANGPTENTPVLLRRPIQTFTGITSSFPGGFGSYDALQMKLERRFSGGLYLLNSFTWSKAIDNAAAGLEAHGGDTGTVDIRDPRANKGMSNYDQPFNNTTTFIWEVPFGRGRRFGSQLHAALDAILGGWRLTGINTMASGSTMSLIYSPAAAFNIGGVQYRADIIGDPMAPKAARNADNYFNRANVVTPTDRTQPVGNVGRNTVRSPSIFQMDTGLHKEFRPKEGIRLDLRAEFFNMLNKTNLGLADSNRTSNQFGSIRSTLPARQVQFGLRLHW